LSEANTLAYCQETLRHSAGKVYYIVVWPLTDKPLRVEKKRERVKKGMVRSINRP